MSLTNFRMSEHIMKVDKKYEHLLPTKFVQSTIEFDVSGGPSVYNAIRKASMDEYETSVLFVDLHDIVTNDEFVINNMIQERLMCIPIDQSAPLDSMYEIKVVNRDLENNMEVSTTHIMLMGKDKAKPVRASICNTMEIFELKPDRQIHVRNIRIKRDFGFKDSKYSVVHTCPVKILDPPTGGNSYLNTTPERFHLALSTNGNLDGRVLIKNTIKYLIEHLSLIAQNIDLVSDIMEVTNLIKWRIEGYSHTFATLIMASVYKTFPEIKLINYAVPIDKREINFSIKHHDKAEMKKILERAIAACVDMFSAMVKSVTTT